MLINFIRIIFLYGKNLIPLSVNPNENKLYRDDLGVWKPIIHKKHGSDGGTIIAYFLRIFETQRWYGDYQSGILNSDEKVLTDIFKSSNKTIKNIYRKNEWLCFVIEL